jgi:hypothetical protein
MIKKQLLSALLLSTILINQRIEGAAQVSDAAFNKAVMVQHPNRERIDQLKADLPAQERRTYFIRKGVMGAAAIAAVYTIGRWGYQWATAPKVEVRDPVTSEQYYMIDGERIVAHESVLKVLKTINPSAWSLAWIGKNMQFYGIPLISVASMGLSYLKDVDDKVSQANFIALMENLQALAQYGEFFDDFKLQNQLPRFVEDDPSRLMGLIIMMTDRLVGSIEDTIAYLEFKAEQLPEGKEKEQENIKSLALYSEGMADSFATDVDQLLTSKDLEPKSLKGLVMDFMAKSNVFFISARTALADRE